MNDDWSQDYVLQLPLKFADSMKICLNAAAIFTLYINSFKFEKMFVFVFDYKQWTI